MSFLADIYVKLITNPIYNILGLTNPYLRFGFFAATAGLAFYFLKPDIMFDSKGNMRPWLVTDPQDEESSVLPLYAAMALFGVFGVLA
jgi:hypothetical protein